jgi:regulator of replication initiation timing
MPRQKPEFINFVKKEYQYANGTFIQGLIEHIEAIEGEIATTNKHFEEKYKDFSATLQAKDAEIERLTDNVAQLYKEKGELSAEIEHLRALVVERTKDEQRMFEECETLRAAWLELEKQVPKKVVLPKEVAQAIEHYRSPQMNFTLKSFARLMFREVENDDNKWTITLKTFVHKEGKGGLLMEALVNGYTVEQTKEDRLREGITFVYEDWCNCDRMYDGTKELIERITDFVTKFNAEN